MVEELVLLTAISSTLETVPHLEITQLGSLVEELMQLTVV